MRNSERCRLASQLIVDYIDVRRDRFGVEPICRVLADHDLPIVPSTYWAHKAQPVTDADWDDAHMANAALDVWRAHHRLYGADKLATAMRKAGYDVSRDQAARLMGIVGIEGVRRGKHRTVTTRRDPGAARHPDLIRRAWRTPTRPDQWWVADFTDLWTLEGFVSTSFVTDVCARGGSSAGESHPRRPHHWSCRPSSRPSSPDGVTTPASPPRAWTSTPTPDRNSAVGASWGRRGGERLGVSPLRRRRSS